MRSRRLAALAALLAGVVAVASVGAGRETTLDGFERFVRADGSFTFRGVPGTNVAQSFAKCQGCHHQPARETDWVYTRGYPRLER